MLGNALLITALVAVVAYAYRRNYHSGLAAALALLVFLPRTLAVELPGALPELTAHRAILLVVCWAWFRRPGPRIAAAHVPFLRLLVLWLLIVLVSLLGAAKWTQGVKEAFSYAMEQVVFYGVVATSVYSEDEAFQLVRAMCYGLVVPAVDGFLARYARVSVLQFLFLGGGLLWGGGEYDATYSHRILFGMAMAMGWPPAVSSLRWPERSW